MSNIIKFYMGEKNENYPYTIDDILDFSDEELEKIHNYIQWLFPTQDPRNKDTGKPFLTLEDIKYFKNSKELLDKVLLSYYKMIGFYGFSHEFKINTEEYRELIFSRNFEIHSRNWLNKGNHNYLRLTRIISCLKSLGLEKEANELFDMLNRTYLIYPNKIGELTLQFWSSAHAGTLYDAYIGKEEEIKQLKGKLASLGSIFTIGNYKA